MKSDEGGARLTRRSREGSRSARTYAVHEPRYVGHRGASPGRACRSERSTQLAGFAEIELNELGSLTRGSGGSSRRSAVGCDERACERDALSAGRPEACGAFAAPSLCPTISGSRGTRPGARARGPLSLSPTRTLSWIRHVREERDTAGKTYVDRATVGGTLVTS